MVEVSVPAAEGVGAVAGCDVLLELQQVVDADVIVEERGFDAQTFGGLKEGRLGGEAGRGGFVEEQADGRDTGGGAGTHVRGSVRRVRRRLRA